MARFIDFSEGQAIMVNNADWLLELNYIELLRDVGVHFSVNRMLTAECFKKRLEKGLSFFEFNYMIMQSYDFLQLFKKHGCIMQLGGDDQWSNMLAGVELIRRKEQKPAYCMTCKLLTTSDGRKMGKTEKGACGSIQKRLHHMISTNTGVISTTATLKTACHSLPSCLWKKYAA